MKPSNKTPPIHLSTAQTQAVATQIRHRSNSGRRHPSPPPLKLRPSPPKSATAANFPASRRLPHHEPKLKLALRSSLNSMNVPFPSFSLAAKLRPVNLRPTRPVNYCEEINTVLKLSHEEKRSDGRI